MSVYSSVLSLHRGIDLNLQVLNSNINRLIRPEEYDIHINRAIDEVYDKMITPTKNIEQKGFQDSFKRNSQLDSLLEVYETETYVRDSKVFASVPSNCQVHYSVNGRVHFNRMGINFETNVTNKYVSTFDLSELDFSSNPSLTILVGTTEVKFDELLKTCRSKKSSFTFFSLVPNFVRESVFGVDCYLANEFQGGSNVFSFIIVSKDPVSCNNKDVKIESKVVEYDTIDEDSIIGIDMGVKELNLIPHIKLHNINDFLFQSNKHLNPDYKFNRKEIELLTEARFTIDKVQITYLRRPRYVNYVIEQMTDFPLINEVIDTASTNLHGVLLSEGYQPSMNKQINN